MTSQPSWYARGLIFENCSCALVCPGHMHFSQNCTHARCKGYWALRIDDGAFGDVSAGGTRAVIAFDTPQRMIDGGWLETIIIDEGASQAQRRALETIFMGHAGGPREKLAAFVATRQPTEFRAIMLLFRNEAQANDWSVARGIPKGDVRPIEQVWAFAAEWYGRHADANWTKWSTREAADIFDRHKLTGPIWTLSAEQARL